MTSYYDIPKVSETEFSRPDFPAWYQGEVKRITAANAQIYQAANAQNLELARAAKVKFDQMIAIAVSLYGEKSAAVKYLRRTGIKHIKAVPQPPDFSRRARKVWREYESWFEDERRREYARDYRRRRAEMNELLQSLGYEPGEHYAPGRALTFAKQVVNPVKPEIRMLPGGENDRD